MVSDLSLSLSLFFSLSLSLFMYKLLRYSLQSWFLGQLLTFFFYLLNLAWPIKTKKKLGNAWCRFSTIVFKESTQLDDPVQNDMFPYHTDYVNYLAHFSCFLQWFTHLRWVPFVYIYLWKDETEMLFHIIWLWVLDHFLR